MSEPTLPLTAPQIHYKTPDEVRAIAVDMSGKLDEGEYLTGTPTVTVTPSGITTASPAVNTVERKILNETVPAGKAITFTASAGTADADYVLKVSCSTTGGQTVQGYVRLNVREA